MLASRFSTISFLFFVCVAFFVSFFFFFVCRCLPSLVRNISKINDYWESEKTKRHTLLLLSRSTFAGCWLRNEQRRWDRVHSIDGLTLSPFVALLGLTAMGIEIRFAWMSAGTSVFCFFVLSDWRERSVFWLGVFPLRRFTDADNSISRSFEARGAHFFHLGQVSNCDR